MKKCVALSADNSPCLKPVYLGATWCRAHVQEGVQRYLQYKTLETNLQARLGRTFMRNMHLGLVDSETLQEWPLFKLQSVRFAVSSIVELRSKCSDLFYAGSDEMTDDDHAHQRVIRCCRETCDLLNTAIETHVASLHGVVVLPRSPPPLLLLPPHHHHPAPEYKRQKTASPGECKRKEEEEETETETECKNHSKKRVQVTDENLDEILVEMRQADLCDEEDRCTCHRCSLSIADLGACCLAAKITKDLRFPTDAEWQQIVRTEPAACMSFATDRMTAPVHLSAELFPFHVLLLTVATADTEHPFSYFLPLHIQHELRELAGLIAATMQVTETVAPTVTELSAMLCAKWDDDDEPEFEWPREAFFAIKMVACYVADIACKINKDAPQLDGGDICNLLMKLLCTRAAFLVCKQFSCKSATAAGKTLVEERALCRPTCPCCNRPCDNETDV